jgi:hypothetical protein
MEGSSTDNNKGVDIITQILKALLVHHQQTDHQKRIFLHQSHMVFYTLGFPPYKLFTYTTYYAMCCILEWAISLIGKETFTYIKNQFHINGTGLHLLIYLSVRIFLQIRPTFLS